jgi:sulfide:quinone oxidoreductase
MDVRYLSKDFAIASQLEPGDLERLSEAGFAAVICNRPDAEGPAQPTFAEIEAEARQRGIEARYLPVVPGKVTEEHGTAFAALLTELPRPVLAYCRTGNRAETLWKLAKVGEPDAGSPHGN